MKKTLSLIIITLVLQACNLNSDSSVNLKPRAKGSIGEIVLVMDTSLWKKPLGLELKELLTSEVPGLPRPEPLYKVHFIDPERLNNVLKGASNMIFVTTLDGSRKMRNFFTPESLEKMRQNPDLFMNSAQNEFARDQEVLQLFGKDEATLLTKIKENRSIIRSHFNEVEKKRLILQYKTDPSEKGIEKTLLNDYGIKMHIPKGFQTAIAKKNFIWLRDMKYNVDRSIFITWQQYTSETMFEKDTIVQWRNKVAKKYLYADTDDSLSYVKTEIQYALVNNRRINFNDNYGVELKALWKTNNISMGGPFVSYTFLDKTSNRLYYIEAFVYSPNVDQRNIVKQLEAVLWTFNTKSTED